MQTKAKEEFICPWEKCSASPSIEMVFWEVSRVIRRNIGLSDILINGQIGIVKYIYINQIEVNALYVGFDNVFAGEIGINGNNCKSKEQ